MLRRFLQQWASCKSPNQMKQRLQHGHRDQQHPAAQQQHHNGKDDIRGGADTVRGSPHPAFGHFVLADLYERTGQHEKYLEEKRKGEALERKFDRP